MQLHYNFPGTGPVIKITDNNLLPHAKQKPIAHNRAAKRWAQQRSAHMGVSIVITPAAIMRIGYVSRRKALKCGAQICYSPAFILNNCQRTGAGLLGNRLKL